MIIEFPNSIPNYTGRLLALNPEKAQKYQCGGFFLGPRTPAAVVPSHAQHIQIHQAILDGRLIELTSGSIKTANAFMDPVQDLGETGFTTFPFVRIIEGVKTVVFVTPSSQEQEDEIKKCIENKIPLDWSKFPELEKNKQFPTHLTKIIMTDI